MDRLSGQHATSRGTTLVELLLVTTLIAITLRIATPSLVALRAEIDTQVAMSRVSHSLANAKITALNSAVIVTLCGSLDGIQCSRHWSDGPPHVHRFRWRSAHRVATTSSFIGNQWMIYWAR
jgi:Tfp pilus assembly protein FimT